MDESNTDYLPSSCCCCSCCSCCCSCSYVTCRHQRALTIVPPDFSIVMNSFHITFRLPLKDETTTAREDIWSLKMDSLSMNVMISSQLFVPLSATVAATTTATTAATGGGSGSASHGSKSGMSPSYANNLHSSSSARSSNSNQNTANNKPQTTATTAGANIVRSLRGFASLVGSLIQLKAQVASISFEIFVKNKELMTVLNGKLCNRLINSRLSNLYIFYLHVCFVSCSYMGCQADIMKT